MTLMSTHASAFVLALGIGPGGGRPSITPAISGSARIANSTTIVLLGSGTPRPDPLASGPATAIIVGEAVIRKQGYAGRIVVGNDRERY